MANVTAVADDVLLERVAGGDRTALNTLFSRYRSIAYRVAFRLLGNEADALDAVQEGFINALKNIEGFRRDSSFKTWLLRVVTNAALDLGRTRQRREAHTDHNGLSMNDRSSEAEAHSPGSELDRVALQEALHQALNKLPEMQRRAFVLHVDGGLSYREIAQTLGVSIGTVMSRLFYARQKLKLLLSAHVNP